MPDSNVIAALIGATFAFAASWIAFRREDRHRFSDERRALYLAYLKALREHQAATGAYAQSNNRAEASRSVSLVSQLSAEAGLLAGDRVLKAITACRSEAAMLYGNHMALIEDGPSPRVADMKDVQDHYEVAYIEFEQAAREELGVDRSWWKML